MSTFKAKSIWTAFITAFFALLASLGLASSTAAATEATVTEPAATSHEHRARTAATPAAPSVRWTLPRDRALPPTMKQRIRAEAHGSSPAARTLAPDTLDTARAPHGTRTALGNAQAQDGVPLPP
ncbi:DUF6344 domain-containing protein [Streptomyces poriferorum]|uniref:DUF6344 domain-containing protein n=1 Tax=Streptomyces poriferorum TaxID=2798799 RepID=A0ABY9ISG8_9ACTN|nr:MULTISPECIES: DUF6344 domain-containing protein [Streptomyces]WSQ45158.1 DUF6344 domain-containing protein [Streptomyces sp. NBC_01220]MBW5250028.1 hypothetical protein [Streptomyces poriferorum]MBW5258127.1 hypothetical protein [Streptomyces poriferorum]MDP5313258.1 DUF6344 domain-containing protein [Streptomyces sp. Alt4]WLQ49562.1 DUF6344 domain-containing protein [Streptomyces sp. Alt1]